jgi:PIN domain nuclease of toxin-antitoxin system
MSDLLLDTCALLWLANGEDLTPDSRSALATSNLHVSPISAWEIANLVRKNRIAFTLPVASWFRQATNKMSAGSPQLTADRIIIATARETDMTVVTRDRQIIDYSRAGHVRALVC